MNKISAPDFLKYCCRIMWVPALGGAGYPAIENKFYSD